jgi:predicted nucleic acid-binding protein
MPWLLDTKILSEIRRLEPEAKVLAFISSHTLDELYISAVTLAELSVRH